jgi:hypothetical protein
MEHDAMPPTSQILKDLATATRSMKDGVVADHVNP